MKTQQAKEGIWVHGARENNLKSVDVFIPRNKLTVITGPSGSGKSSLAFDTLYAEGQRRYVESLSTYARYFMEKLKTPDVDSVFGLCPVVAIDQKTISSNPRSTVGTITEVYDYLRLLFTKIGAPHCPIHDQPVKAVSPSAVVQNILKMKNKTQFKIFSPVIRGKKGEMTEVIQKYIKKGYVYAKIDGKMISLNQAQKLNKRKSHDIDILVDQLFSESRYQDRIAKSIHLALSLSGGFVKIEQNEKSQIYSTQASCPVCLYSFPEIEPQLFSFNTAKGACPQCKGLGFIDEDWLDDESSHFLNDIESEISLQKKSYTDDFEKEDEWDEQDLCPKCRGGRLNRQALSVFISGRNIFDLAQMELEELELFFKKLKLNSKDKMIADKILEEIFYHLDILKKVGVSYLSLNRTTGGLSGGEAQRIRLAGQISSPMVGVLYILDEPSIGLHPSNHQALLSLIEKIKQRQNTIVMVEHDEQTMRQADYIVDVGPGAGQIGGRLVFQGDISSLIKNKKSLTGDYLAKRKMIAVPKKRRKSQKFIELYSASGNNLKNVDLKIPLSTLISITGVSGSGKSSLIVDTLYKALSNRLYKSGYSPLPFKKLKGASQLDKIIVVNQKPIGRTSRSVPATYVGVMSLIRMFMSALPSAQIRGFNASHFSFNIGKGRCSYCDGVGVIKQEMHFLSHALTVCEMCQGKRYSFDVLSVVYKDKNISDILNMTVRQACAFFKNHPLIYQRLKTLDDVGLSYLKLGQSSSTLSGGEAQRIKLTRELAKRETGRALYILDEPTTGLHFEDIKKLLKVLNHLVDRGNTVMVIEHNMDVIKCSDYVIDLGPGGGKHGGWILAQGTPEKMAQTKKSLTGFYLKKSLKG